MLPYLLRRLFWMIPTLLGIVVVTFGLMHLAPGDPTLAALGLQEEESGVGAEDMARIGIRIRVANMDSTTYRDQVRTKDFGLASGGWSIDPENDPEQLWHSRGAAPDHRGSNRASVADPYVDELIARGQLELDDEARWAIWRELHRHLYEEVMPYLFRLAPPTKFAMSRSIRGVQVFHIAPGFTIRRWYYPAGTPGTRATREK